MSDRKVFAILVTVMFLAARLPAFDCPADSAAFVDLDTTSTSYGETVATGLCACLDFGATLSATDSTVTLSILLHENEPLRGFQFEIADNSNNALVLRSVTAGDEISSWSVSSRESSAGTAVVFGFSLSGEETVAQSEGVLLEVTFDMAGRLGEKVAFFLDQEAGVLLSDADAENVACLFPTSDDPATYPVDWLAVSEDQNPIPSVFTLHQNYPNPFNPETTIQYDLARAGHVALIIHDLLGREVEVAVNSWQEAGTHSVMWNGRDAAGREVASGIYIATLRAGDFVDQKKMVLLQ